MLGIKVVVPPTPTYFEVFNMNMAPLSSCQRARRYSPQVDGCCLPAIACKRNNGKVTHCRTHNRDGFFTPKGGAFRSCSGDLIPAWIFGEVSK